LSLLAEQAPVDNFAETGRLMTCERIVSLKATMWDTRRSNVQTKVIHHYGRGHRTLHVRELGREASHDETSSSCKLTVGQGKISGLLRPRSIEKLRYVNRHVKLASDESYGSSLSLLRSESVPSYDRLL
jgi:hypothetical protein